MATDPSDIAASVRCHPDVVSVELTGSRADGTASAYSDWDFLVHVTNFVRLRNEVEPLLVNRHAPLAVQWDPLSNFACCMVLLDGPKKVDLIFPGIRNALAPPWHMSADTLAGIDKHFWDWTLWLVAKAAANKLGLVETELQKMWIHLLNPMGVTHAPADLMTAVALYLEARDRAEQRFVVRVGRAVQKQVLAIPYFAQSAR